jgi:hypothetical protein
MTIVDEFDGIKLIEIDDMTYKVGRKVFRGETAWSDAQRHFSDLTLVKRHSRG